MRTSRNVRVDCHGKDELVVVFIEIIEMIEPEIFC